MTMKKLVIILIIILTLVFMFVMKDILGHITIVAKFDDLEPLEKQMNVYYKGFKVGRTTKIFPDKEYKNTYIKLKLHPRNINLPDNIIAKIKKTKLSSGYINLIYPDSPSITKIKDNTEIKGVLSQDINNILNDRLDSEVIDEIVTDATSLIDNANTAVKNLSDIFVDVRSIINDSRKDIKIATSNLAKTTQSLQEMSTKLNKSVTQDTMDKSVENIQESTENIKNITDNLNGITTQVNTTTMPIVNSVLCQTHSTVKNVNEITGGVKNTLKKHMGLGRLLFGRPISNDCP